MFSTSSFFKFLTVSSLTLIAMLENSKAAVTIGHVENGATGVFVSSTGASLTTGGVTVGYFTVAAPSDWSSFTAATAYSTLTGGTYGFVDVRNASGATQAGGFDWSFPSTLGGTVNNIALAALPANTRLYILAFDNGTIANGFSGSTEWAAVSDTAYLSPADLGTKSLLLSAVDTAGERFVSGGDDGLNLRLSAAPEPTRAFAMLIGLFGLALRRRR